MTKGRNLKDKINLESVLEEINIGAIQAGLALGIQVTNSPRIAKGLAFASTGLAVGKFALDNLRSLRTRNQYTIRISESDALFMKVQSWLFDNLPYEDQRSVVVSAKSARSGTPQESIDSLLANPSRNDFLDVLYDGERSAELNIDGHPIEISVEVKSPDALRKTSKSNLISREIIVTAKSIEGRDAVLRLLTDESKKVFARRPRFWSAQKWGNFRAVSDVPVRPVETVVLREKQMERIIEQITLFLAREDLYVKLGIPWHMGVLLYGPPGSGKTSVATAIAHSLGLDIYFISLSSMEDDAALLEIAEDINSRSILLLEDVDVAKATGSREEGLSVDGRGVTLQGLLQVLDGLNSQHGVITIMSTNYYDRLDPALIRPGRVDVREEIGYVDTVQIENLCNQFLGFVPDGIPTITAFDRIVSAEIVEVFKKNIDHLEDAGKELVVFLKAKKLVSDEEVSDNHVEKAAS